MCSPTPQSLRDSSSSKRSTLLPLAERELSKRSTLIAWIKQSSSSRGALGKCHTCHPEHSAVSHINAETEMLRATQYDSMPQTLTLINRWLSAVTAMCFPTPQSLRDSGLSLCLYLRFAQEKKDKVEWLYLPMMFNWCKGRRRVNQLFLWNRTVPLFGLPAFLEPRPV